MTHSGAAVVCVSHSRCSMTRNNSDDANPDYVSNAWDSKRIGGDNNCPKDVREKASHTSMRQAIAVAVVLCDTEELKGEGLPLIRFSNYGS